MLTVDCFTSLAAARGGAAAPAWVASTGRPQRGRPPAQASLWPLPSLSAAVHRCRHSRGLRATCARGRPPPGHLWPSSVHPRVRDDVLVREHRRPSPPPTGIEAPPRDLCPALRLALFNRKLKTEPNRMSFFLFSISASVFESQNFCTRSPLRFEEVEQPNNRRTKPHMAQTNTAQMACWPLGFPSPPPRPLTPQSSRAPHF